MKKIDLMSSENERKLQKLHAPQLRQAAINHLATSTQPVAKSFRNEYRHLSTKKQSHQRFLARQAQPGVWGSYIELAALGELFKCTVIVTPLKEGVTQSPICLYRAESTKVIHLYNSDNSHWHVNDQTLTDGNCLYNAFAQALQRQFIPMTESACLAKNSFLTSDRIKAYQQSIADAIMQQPLPNELDQQLLDEQTRIAKLPLTEQLQINNDYELALQLAQQEITPAKLRGSSSWLSTEENSKQPASVASSVIKA